MRALSLLAINHQKKALAALILNKCDSKVSNLNEKWQEFVGKEYANKTYNSTL